MNAKRSVALALLVFAASVTTGCGAVRPRPAAKREAGYQAELRSYSAVLTPGMVRKDVEASFQTKGVRFRQMCCVAERAGLDDLVKIGKESHPWYCSEHNVYVAFEFTAVAPGDNYVAGDSDVLRKVTIFHWLEGCL